MHCLLCQNPILSKFRFCSPACALRYVKANGPICNAQILEDGIKKLCIAGPEGHLGDHIYPETT